MQNLIKLAAWIAPAFLLALIIILGRLDRNNAQQDVDTAQFNKEFAHQQVVLSLKNDKKFWIEERKKAEEKIKVAEKKKAMADGKVSQQIDIIEKTLKGMDKENEK